MDYKDDLTRSFYETGDAATHTRGKLPPCRVTCRLGFLSRTNCKTKLGIPSPKRTRSGEEARLQPSTGTHGEPRGGRRKAGSPAHSEGEAGPGSGGDSPRPDVNTVPPRALPRTEAATAPPARPPAAARVRGFAIGVITGTSDHAFPSHK